MERFLDMVYQFLSHYPLIAPIIFIGVHTLMAVLFLPCSPMTLMAGALWGQSYGLVISMIAAIASSSTTFLLSRSFFRKKIEKFLVKRYPKVTVLLAHVVQHDWKIIAVSQMNPMLPASTMGYIFGLSGISLSRYVLFSGLFFLPLQVLFVLSGHSAVNLIDSHKKLGYSAISIILLIVFVFISKPIYKTLCRFFGIKNGS